MDFQVGWASALFCRMIAMLAVAVLHGIGLAQVGKGTGAATPVGTGMQKVVTDKASFVLYVPKGWKVQEASQGQSIQVIASDPSGRSSVFFSTGEAQQGENAAALAKREAAKLGRTARDLEIRSAFISQTAHRSYSTGPTRRRSGGKPSSVPGYPCRGANPPVPASRRRQASSLR